MFKNRGHPVKGSVAGLVAMSANCTEQSSCSFVRAVNGRVIPCAAAHISSCLLLIS